MRKKTVYIRLLLLTGILIMINLIAGKKYFRLDFTADKQYTLSEASREIIGDIDDVITITAYFSANLPAQLKKAHRDFEDMLIEYENRADGNIVFQFVNPNASEEMERKAQEAGIRPVMVNVTQKDQAQQIRAYMGATLQKGDEIEVLPLIQPGAGVEYGLTTAIKKLIIDDKPNIAFLQGQGEPPMDASAQVLEQLSILYDVEDYTVTDSTEIPSYFRSVAIINPTDSFSQNTLDQLDRYLNGGGNLFIAYSNLQTDLSQQFLAPKPDIGLTAWLKEKGIQMDDRYLIDAASGSISVQQNMGGFIMNTQKPFPFFPVISRFADQPATEGLEAVILPMASALDWDASDSTIQIQPLAYTSDHSGFVLAPVMIDINREWTNADFDQGPQVVALSASGPLGGAGASRMVLISNGGFAVNGSGQQAQRVSEDNVNLVSNSIDWLSDDTGLINLRTKGITSRPLTQVDDATRNLYKYGNMLAPILLILGIALVRRQRARTKRQNWKEGNL